METEGDPDCYTKLHIRGSEGKGKKNKEEK